MDTSMAEQLQLESLKFKKDSLIVIEGTQQADRLYIITGGQVHITKDSMSVIKERDVLGPGDFFGVISSLSSHSHIENVRALTEVSVISVKKRQYAEFIRNNSPVAMKIILQFSKQMRYLDEALAIRTLKQKGNDDVSYLFDVADYYQKQRQFNQAYFVFDQYLKHCPNGDKRDLVKDYMAKISLEVDSDKLKYREVNTNRVYPKNTMFFSEAEPGDELYIIERGAVKITKIINQQEVLLAVLKNGDIFGEMALLENKPRTASALAYEDCVVTAVNRENFKQMVVTNPEIIARLTGMLADRIWLIYKQLTSTLLTEPMARMYDVLSIQLEKNRVRFEQLDLGYEFDFGPKELINMVGLSQIEGSDIVNKMLKSKDIAIQHDKIYCPDVHGLVIKSRAEWKRQQRSTGVK
jgi:CRP-like cAMP-binding protein